MTTKPVRVLVDTCALQHGVLISKSRMTQHSAQWGKSTVTYALPAFERPALSSDHAWLREQIDNLPTIAAAMTSGKIQAYTTGSLKLEGPDKQSWANGSRADLWREVTFQHVDSPLERSTFMSTADLKKHFDGDYQQHFCKLLLDIERRGLSPEWVDALELDAFERANLARLGEFRAMCTVVGETRWRDAFHFWTAECNDLEYFLTTDQKFLNAIRGSKRLKLQSRAVSAAELVSELALPFVPAPISEGESWSFLELLRD